ncbi:retrovirus-related Pol polyprotein from transposon 412 [Trichonephila clavipes]|nr:retrovirus-related Pol polyprotein from transposon 412 [Trichonephila clavipes]
MHPVNLHGGRRLREEIQDLMAQRQNLRRRRIMCWGWQDIAPFHPTTKRYWALWDSLYLRKGVLYRKWESDDGKTFRWQLIFPKTRVSTVLKELHGSPIGDHFGVMKTLQKVCEHFYWNNVRSDVEKCCRKGDPCVARKGPRKRTRGRLQLYNVGAPFERISF